jgi:hypothetical protein
MEETAASDEEHAETDEGRDEGQYPQQHGHRAHPCS